MTTTTPNQSNRMARTLATTLVVGLCIGLALGYALFGQQPPTPTTLVEPPLEVVTPPAPETPPEEEPAEEPLVVPATTPPLAARQLFVYIGGTNLDKRAAASLREFAPGGVVFRDENIESPVQVRGLVLSIQSAAREEYRPIIALDASPEGYRRLGLDMVMRFEELGLLNNPDAVREAGWRRGDAARAVGVEAVLAPPLDVFVPGLSDETLRAACFSEDVDRVSELGLAFAEGVKEAGAIPVAGHFPGLGLVEKNDVGRSVIIVADKNDLANLISPFDRAVAAQIPGMVVTHAEMTAVDPGIPASQSHNLLGTLVREKWDYDGVLLADGILTHPMTSGLAPEEAVLLALSAGCDAVIVEDTDRRILLRICEAMAAPENETLLPEADRAASRARLDAWRLAPLEPEAETPALSPQPEVPAPAVEPATPEPTVPAPVVEVETGEAPEPVIEEEEAVPGTEVTPPVENAEDTETARDAGETAEATVEKTESVPATEPEPTEETPTPEPVPEEPVKEDGEPVTAQEASPEEAPLPEPESATPVEEGAEPEPVDEAPTETPDDTLDAEPAKAASETPDEAPTEAPAQPEADVPPDTKLHYHRIEQGESLMGIAGKYGVRVSDIKRWNDMKDDTIKYGFRLKVYLPLAEEPTAETAVETSTSPETIEPEVEATEATEEVETPAEEETHEPAAPALAEEPESTVAEPETGPATEDVEAVPEESDAEPLSEEEYITYRVVGGDRLDLIAAKYGTTKEQLMELNKLEDPNHIWVGQKLKIPAPGPSDGGAGSGDEEQ